MRERAEGGGGGMGGHATMKCTALASGWGRLGGGKLGLAVSVRVCLIPGVNPDGHTVTFPTNRVKGYLRLIRRGLRERP